jgi:hypothetical protein
MWKMIICVEYFKSHSWWVNTKTRLNWQPSWSQKEEKWEQSIWCKFKLKLIFMFLEYSNTVLLRGACRWSENNQVKSFHPSKIETTSWTLSGSARHYPASLEDQPQFKNHSQKSLTGHFSQTFQNLLEKASFFQRALTGQCPRFEYEPND